MRSSSLRLPGLFVLCVHLLAGCGPGSGGAPLEAPKLGATGQPLGTVYNIGPNQLTFDDVPWDSLGPGDTVSIAYSHEPYRVKLVLGRSGTASAPIRIVGVPGPNGELPIIDGENASTPANSELSWAPLGDQGVILVTRMMATPWPDKPRYIEIENLEVRNGRQDFTYHDQTNTLRRYAKDAAGIFIFPADHITVRNCEVHHSGNGIFVNNGNSPEMVTSDILIERSYIHDNGNAGSYHEHNVYTEASGITVQYNRFERPLAGSLGNNFKDRSVGLVFRYNWLVGGAHLLDLVEPQQSWPMVKDDPRLKEAHVYGNVLIADQQDGVNLIHWGREWDATSRDGTLYFYGNTVAVTSQQVPDHWRTSIFQTETNGFTIDARNNIFHRAGTADFQLLSDQGNLNLGANWITQGWKLHREEIYGYDYTGTATGVGNLITGNEPGFTSFAGRDLRLLPGSAGIDTAGPLYPLLPPGYEVSQQYVVHRGQAPRSALGGAMDLGAFERSQ